MLLAEKKRLKVTQKLLAGICIEEFEQELLLAIFALLSGVFFPLVTPGVPFDHVIQGVAALFLGLVGTILLFKAVTSDTRQGIFIVVGFASITISLVLIYQLREVFMSHYF